MDDQPCIHCERAALDARRGRLERLEREGRTVTNLWAAVQSPRLILKAAS